MVHYVFWLFSRGAPASQPARGGGGVPKPPSHPAAARRSSSEHMGLNATVLMHEIACGTRPSGVNVDEPSCCSTHSFH